MEMAWRDAVFHNFRFWRHIADVFNPLLGLALLGIFFVVRRRDTDTARNIGARALFSLVVTWAVVRDLRFFVFSNFDMCFPSGHLAFALCAALNLLFLKRATWRITLPLLLFYAWLMTALRFHDWIDLMGAVPVSLASFWAVSHLMRKSIARRSL